MTDPTACPACGMDLAPHHCSEVSCWCCQGCERLWIPRSALEARLADIPRTFRPDDLRALRDEGRRRREESVQLALHGEEIQYHDCPVCATRMGRINFGRVSGILVHECPEHGTLVASSDFEPLIGFVERGGEVAALEHERDELAERLAALQRRAKEEGRPSRKRP